MLPIPDFLFLLCKIRRPKLVKCLGLCAVSVYIQLVLSISGRARLVQHFSSRLSYYCKCNELIFCFTTIASFVCTCIYVSVLSELVVKSLEPKTKWWIAATAAAAAMDCCMETGLAFYDCSPFFLLLPVPSCKNQQ